MTAPNPPEKKAPKMVVAFIYEPEGYKMYKCTDVYALKPNMSALERHIHSDPHGLVKESELDA